MYFGQFPIVLLLVSLVQRSKASLIFDNTSLNSDTSSSDIEIYENNRTSIISHFVVENSTPTIITPSVLKPKLVINLVKSFPSRIFEDTPTHHHQTRPVLLANFVNNYGSSTVYLINFLSINSTPEFSPTYLNDITVPLILQTNLQTNLYTSRKRFQSLTRHLITFHHDLVIFILPFPFSDDIRRNVLNYFQPPRPYYSSKFDATDVDSPYKDVLYFFGSTARHQDPEASKFPLEKVIRFGALLNRDLTLNGTLGISNFGNTAWEAYTGTVFSDGRIVKLFYICFYCEFRRFHLYQISHRDMLPEKIRKRTFDVNLGGMNYLWSSRSSDSPADIGSMPYLEEMSPQEIISKQNFTRLNRLILRFLLTGSNYTKFLHKSLLDTHSEEYDAGGPAIISEMSASHVYHLHLQRVYFDHDSYNFIGCHGVQVSQHGFAVYFAPFEKSVWIGILLSLIIAPGVLSFVLYFLFRIEFSRNFIFLLYAFSSSFITQYPCGRGDSLKLVPFKHAFQSVYGSFLLACIVVVNMYVGLIISEITSPPLPIPKYQQLQTLENSILLAPLSEGKYYRRQLEYLINVSREDFNGSEDARSKHIHREYEVFSIYSAVGKEIHSALADYTGNCFMYHLLSPTVVDQAIKNRTSIPSFCWTLASLSNQLLAVIDPLESIATTLAANECEDKKFYVVLNSEIDYIWARLCANYTKVPFYKGKSAFFYHATGWKVSKFGNSKGPMAERLETLVRSGLYGFLKSLIEFSEWRNVQRISAIRNTKTYQPYILENASITFFVFLVCHSIAFVGLIVENVAYRCKTTKIPHD